MLIDVLVLSAATCPYQLIWMQSNCSFEKMHCLQKDAARILTMIFKCSSADANSKWIHVLGSQPMIWKVQLTLVLKMALNMNVVYTVQRFSSTGPLGKPYSKPRPIHDGGLDGCVANLQAPRQSIR